MMPYVDSSRHQTGMAWHCWYCTVFQRRSNMAIPYLQVPALKAATSPITGRLSGLCSPRFATIYRHKPYAVRRSAPSMGMTKSGSRSLGTLVFNTCAETCSIVCSPWGNLRSRPYCLSLANYLCQSYRYCVQPALVCLNDSLSSVELLQTCIT